MTKEKCKIYMSKKALYVFLKDQPILHFKDEFFKDFTICHNQKKFQEV